MERAHCFVIQCENSTGWSTVDISYLVALDYRGKEICLDRENRPLACLRVCVYAGVGGCRERLRKMRVWVGVERD